MTMPTTSPHLGSIGLVLGSGSARGWSHVGVIRALAEMGVEPDIVCGTSIGALVGAAYVSGHLDTLESRIRDLNRRDLLHYMDFTLTARGGFFAGEGMMDFFRQHIGDVSIEGLPKPFATVATDLTTGREVWLERGPLLQAVRASIALPGIFTPVQSGDQWLVDGGLVNPVPVSLCRAMGAEMVIAVNLNGDLADRYLSRNRAKADRKPSPNAEGKLLDRLSNGIKERATTLMSQALQPFARTPGLFDVLATSINIMQEHITRSRMVEDPPDVVLAPRLAHLGLLKFDRGEEAIEEGAACVGRMRPVLRDVLGGAFPSDPEHGDDEAP